MGHVALTIDGRYLRISPLGEELRICADGDAMDSSSIFERLPLPHDRIALRTPDGFFLAVRPDPCHNFGLYPEEAFTPQAVFEEILWPDGQISLRTSELTFVSGAGDATVTANRVEPGCSERFRPRPVPASMLPLQRSSTDDGTFPLVVTFPRQSAPSVTKEHSRSQR
jgi:hypothetical protein